MVNNLFTTCFILHRFLQNTSNVDLLLSRLNEDDKQAILDLQQYRIKKYMLCYCNEKQHSDATQDALHLIANNFSKEYNSIISYKNIEYYNIDASKHKYYKLLFKQSDLVHYIFQHLCYMGNIEEINNCSLVDSIWLYHSFHPQCLKYLNGQTESFNLSKLKTVNKKRVWQRFSQIFHFYFKHTVYIESFTRNQVEFLINGLNQIKIENIHRLFFQLTINVNNPVAVNLYHKMLDILCNNKFLRLKHLFFSILFMDDKDATTDENTITSTAIADCRMMMWNK